MRTNNILTFDVEMRSSKVSKTLTMSQEMRQPQRQNRSATNPSRSPNKPCCDMNLDGLSIAVVSCAFNSFASLHNSMICQALRSSAPLHCLSDSSIVSNHFCWTRGNGTMLDLSFEDNTDSTIATGRTRQVTTSQPC